MMKRINTIVFLSFIVLLGACATRVSEPSDREKQNFSGIYFSDGEHKQALVLKETLEFEVYDTLSSSEITSSATSRGSWNMQNDLISLCENPPVFNRSYNPSPYPETTIADSLSIYSSIWDVSTFPENGFKFVLFLDTLVEYTIPYPIYLKKLSLETYGIPKGGIYKYALMQQYPKPDKLSHGILPYKSIREVGSLSENKEVVLPLFTNLKYLNQEDRLKLNRVEFNYGMDGYSQQNYDLVYVNADGTLYWQGCIWKKQ